ncbi:MAG: hypothetical protein KGJ79_12365 [Alphaproteobacteria bacterium]|nr:hypothetical protein [Alphaproteobacteria bacterium]MDE2111929.1 hypothetical protein [Alphaproteobacteria bacterium]MDE2493128.1 hypothetical protein [Alphaproteobacteria bacterium]
MAEARKSGEGALAEGAERFDRLVRIVKDSQLSRTKAGPKPPITEAFVLSPDEAWAKKYMTQCIGPVCFGPLTEPPPFVNYTAPPLGSVKSHDFSVSEAARTAQRDAKEPIGRAIGKPSRRRTWLGRLLKGL